MACGLPGRVAGEPQRADRNRQATRGGSTPAADPPRVARFASQIGAGRKTIQLASFRVSGANYTAEEQRAKESTDGQPRPCQIPGTAGE